MARLILLICAIFIVTASGQNIEKMCRQLLTNCQACDVFRSECVVTNRPTQKPTQKPVVVPGYPDSPSATGDDSAIVPQQCYEIGKLCDTSADCCSRNCKVIKILLGDNSNQYYTQRVCRPYNT